MTNLGKYNKFWIALIGAAVSLITIYFAGEPWVVVVVNFLTAVGVYTVPNTTSYRVN